MSELINEGLAWADIKQAIKLIEDKTCTFYAVRRVNFYLCDHKRQEIYKIIEDDYGKEQLIYFK